MPDYGELAAMTAEERAGWAESATRGEIVGCLMQAAEDGWVDLSHSDLLEELANYVRNGVRGYEEIPLEELRAELLAQLAEGDE